MLPVCIATPRLDGHTRGRFPFDPGMLDPSTAFESGSRELAEMSLLISGLRRRTREERLREKREGRNWRNLPTPAGDIAAEVESVGGEGGEVIGLHVHDRIYIGINLGTGVAALDWKAKELWSAGFERAARFWIDAAWRMLIGRPCDLEDAYASGFSMTGIEMCADFVGLAWKLSHAGLFLGRFREQDVHSRSDDLDLPVTVHVPPTSDALAGSLDIPSTGLEIGRRKNAVSFCLYDKTGQILSKGRASPNPSDRDPMFSTYWPTWRVGLERAGFEASFDPLRTVPYDGPEIGRVEQRFSGRGLELDPDEVTNEETGEVVDLNFRDPMVCANREALLILWVRTATKYRLIVPNTATRRERCATDPMWERIVACAEAPAIELRQRRDVPDGAHAERWRRAVKKTARGLAELAALSNHTITHEGGLHFLSEVAARLIEKYDGATVGGLSEGYYALQIASLGDSLRERGPALLKSAAVARRGVELIESLDMVIDLERKRRGHG